MQTAIWWIRRDLRLRDNEALTAAVTQAEFVIPVFIIEPRYCGLAQYRTETPGFSVVRLTTTRQTVAPKRKLSYRAVWRSSG
jgi:deoxyribodipyrimidine photo-lyase